MHTHMHNRNEYLCPPKYIYKNIYVSQKVKAQMLIYNRGYTVIYSCSGILCNNEKNYRYTT